MAGRFFGLKMVTFFKNTHNVFPLPWWRFPITNFSKKKSHFLIIRGNTRDFTSPPISPQTSALYEVFILLLDIF